MTVSLKHLKLAFTSCHRSQFTDEFKAGVVRLVLDDGKTVGAVATRDGSHRDRRITSRSNAGVPIGRTGGQA
jgi:transposase-like protein